MARNPKNGQSKIFEISFSHLFMSENRYLLNIWPQGRIFKKLINLKTMETKIDELVRYYRKITELTVFNGLY